MRRREVFAGIGAVALTAGCLGDTTGAPETTDEGDRETARKGADEDAADSESAEGKLKEMPADMDEIEYRERYFARTHETPTWAESQERPFGNLELYDSADWAREALPFEAVADGREDELREFVDGTDFGRSRLLYVVAVGLGTSDLVTGV
ncbi:hypothetical protein [Halorussus amylolyticus]|uniref:hypothetical protein n=1 Tax=Halorussus amylolyticus TaxID=1126242 RepID=UPI00104D23E3|nr:hypothetical protein [Halorussus amylolyticus]